MVSIAIVGGGITGSTVAHQLLRLVPDARLTVFDQGRGLGGRTSHRRLEDSSSKAVVSPVDDGSACRFDHGCQFFRADSDEFKSEILSEWTASGYAAEWRGKFGGGGDFFGVPSDPRPVYVGVGGMHRIAMSQLAAAESSGRVSVNTGTRVSSVERTDRDKWTLSGTSGKAAFHDTSEKTAAEATTQALGTDFDFVVCTDASSAQGGWHRASAGLGFEVERIAERPRVALFTSLVVFDPPLDLGLDAVSPEDGPVWFAARTASKPGLESTPGDCWTLVSTPQFALREIQQVPMRDPQTGAFRPQQRDYLVSGPGKALLDAFKRMYPCNDGNSVVVSAQRWGSAFPAPITFQKDSADVAEVVGTSYLGLPRISLLPSFADNSKTPEPNGAPARQGAAADPKKNTENDYFVEPVDAFFYAGDFCSTRTPGVESAALSALHCARSIADRVVTKGKGAC